MQLHSKSFQMLNVPEQINTVEEMEFDLLRCSQLAIQKNESLQDQLRQAERLFVQTDTQSMERISESHKFLQTPQYQESLLMLSQSQAISQSQAVSQSQVISQSQASKAASSHLSQGPSQLSMATTQQNVRLYQEGMDEGSLQNSQQQAYFYMENQGAMLEEHQYQS
mmetsp:Transcript_9143/g.15407  ORF Transcript_9143/g.15407 Transcript_9143/m.15407 type:complete len:167 (+) Transcript_9143:462-962(+)